MLVTIPCGLRTPLTLTQKSAHVNLASLGFLNGEQQGQSVETALEQLGAAFHSRDFEAVFRSEVALTRGDGKTVHVQLSSANTQLHGLNASAEEFRFGYEPEIGVAIDFFVPDAGVMVDVGANFGYFPLYLACRPGFVGSIQAFEPSSRGFADLQLLVSNSGLGERIQTHKLALSDSAGTIDLLLATSDGLSTTVPSMANQIEKVVGRESVPVQRLDDFALQRLDLVKIDVEGAETKVIAGALQTLRALAPVVVFESWSFIDDSAGFRLLLDCDYAFFVAGWPNAQGQITRSLTQAATREQMVLVEFSAENRKTLPSRINVMAIPKARLAKLPPSMITA